MYDWANSAFATSILAFIFVVYFVEEAAKDVNWEIGVFTIKGSTLWPLTIFLSFFFIIAIAPLLGAIADNLKNKKKFLFFFCYLGAAATMGLFFVAPGNWKLGMVLFIISNIGFVGGNVFYNGLIKDVSNDDNIAFMSGMGWGVGYLGGFILLIVNLVMIMFWDRMGFPSGQWAARTTFLTVGVWWALFSIPIFLFVKEKKGKVPKVKGVKILTMGFKQLKDTVKHLPKYPVLFLFLGSFFLFHDAIQTTISQAANFGTSALGMSINQILIAGVIIQFVAIIGSFGFLVIEKKFGTKKTLIVSLIIWIVVLSWALFMHNWKEFYVMSVIIGLVLGVSQSGARTLFGQFIPKERSAEFFSLYGIVGKVSSLVGPLLFALVDSLTSTRYAVIPLVVMMFLGMLLLLKVDVKKGLEQAKKDV
jgi:UMF1 family MFS transporter